MVGESYGAACHRATLNWKSPLPASSIWFGHQLRPLLAPLTLRAKALPLAFKIAVALAPRHYSSLVHGVLLVRPLGRSMVEDVSTSCAVAAAMLVAALA